MRVLSLFSGVGGFDMGLEAAGMTTVFQCEIDPHCQQTLRHHWPDVPKWDDVSTLTGAHILSYVDGVDVVAWGSPCQDLSVAGKRAGLAGERSGLFHQGIRIIKELTELSNGTYPTFSIWENVAGALSSNAGADFGQVLSEMDEAGACFSEWAVLDAQFFGVPQRRRRVFVVSCFDTATASRCPEPLLALGESRTGNLAKGKPKRQDPAGEVADSVGDGGRTVRDVVGSLSPGAHPGGLNGQDAYTGQLVVEPPIAFSHTQGLDAQPSEDAWPTLRKEGSGHAVAYDEYNDALGGDVHHALRAGTRQSTGVVTTMQVRRLTPIECERLMGWPDSWTSYRADGKTNSDTTRYKMCGNGVASPVAQWVGQQIMAVHRES